VDITIGADGNGAGSEFREIPGNSVQFGGLPDVDSLFHGVRSSFPPCQQRAIDEEGRGVTHKSVRATALFKV